MLKPGFNRGDKGKKMKTGMPPLWWRGNKERGRHNREKGVIEAKNSSLIVSYCKFDKDIFHIGCILPNSKNS